MRLRRTAVLAGVLATAPVLAGSAGAQDGDGLGGYTLGSRGNGVQLYYDLPGSLPVGPIVDVSGTEAQSRLTSGPTGFALSSTQYPGPMVLGASSLATQGGAPPMPIDSSQYPFYVTAATTGPTESRDDQSSPGSTMYAKAEGPFAQAVTTTGAQDASPVMTIGGTRAEATLQVGATAVSTTLVEVSDISLLDGALLIQSVITDLRATSDGVLGTSEGGTRVSGATLMGEGVVIDENGIHEEGGNESIIPYQDGVDSLNEALAAFGLQIYVAQPEGYESGPAAGRQTHGLVIEVTAELGESEAGPVFDNIPPLPDLPGSPLSPNDLVQILQAYQISTISIGQGQVDVTASPAFVLPPLPAFTPAAPAPPEPPAAAANVPVFAAPPAPSTQVDDGTPEVAAPAPATMPVAATPTIPFAEVPGAGLFLLAGLTALVATLGSRKLPDWAMDGAVSDAVCVGSDAPGGTA